MAVDYIAGEKYNVGILGINDIHYFAHVGCVVAVSAGVEVGELYDSVSFKFFGQIREI